MKLCTVCGVVTSGAGSRCSKHPRLSGIGANHRIHADPRWARLSKRVIARHVGQHGYVCPGYGRDAHPASDLTIDHVVPLAAGGLPFDIANCAVLCGSCNSTKGASEPDRGDPHAGSALLEDRARQLYARGRVSREIPVVADPGRGDGRPRAPRLAHVPR
jgi:5-methylcytosine-specific restriction protein A